MRDRLRAAHGWLYSALVDIANADRRLLWCSWRHRWRVVAGGGLFRWSCSLCAGRLPSRRVLRAEVRAVVRYVRPDPPPSDH